MQTWKLGWLAVVGLAVTAGCGGTGNAAAVGEQVIYAAGMQNGWQNWSWARVDLASTDMAHSGTKSVKVTYTGAWQGLYLHHEPQDPRRFAALTFWINPAGDTNRELTVAGLIDGKPAGGTQVALSKYVDGGALAANAWRQVKVPLADLGLSRAASFDGIWLMGGAAAQPALYVDDIALEDQPASSGTNSGAAATSGAGATSGAAAPTNAPVAVKIDAAAARHPISPLIYGVAFANAAALQALNCPLNRSGGNATTSYNWALNASNRGSDWFFESIADDSAVPGASGDSFIKDSRAGGAEPMLTIPMIGWVAKLGPDRRKLASYSIAKYGPQTKQDQWMPDAGNGISAKDKKPITNNDPNDANVPSDPAFQKKWVQHLVQTWGASDRGGLKYYLMDNEPSIWQGTHQDVHPVGPKMEEIRDKVINYAAMVRSLDPGAQIVAPEEWGWSGYLYSGYDQQWGGAHGWGGKLPDRAAHGDMDYLPWLLQQLHAHDQQIGKRSIDYFTVHYYPQGGEGGGDTSNRIQLLRNRSTRSLWDPAYKDESWINAKIQLIPRMKDWVKTYYPGLKTGVTEYNWGAEDHINGATAQADVLGIFGREGLDMATRWTCPDPKTPTFKAMQMYRNCDGKKDGFGDESVSDTVPDPDSLSSFAAIRQKDGALTVMIINKVLDGQTPVTLDLAGFHPGGAAQVWQLTDANEIRSLPNVQAQGNSLALTVPSQSITLLVIPRG